MKLLTVAIAAAAVVLLYTMLRRAYYSLVATQANRLGRVTYADNGQAPLMKDPGHQLFGKPDAVVQVKRWFRAPEERPLEYKTGNYRDVKVSHVAQLASQGLLIEAQGKPYPSWGYLQYGNRVIPVRLGGRARRQVLRVMDAMRGEKQKWFRAKADLSCNRCVRRGECPFNTG